VRQAIEVLSESEVSHRLVDRALGELRPEDVSGAPYDTPYQADVRSCMRDELFGLMAHLHFSEISSRELAYAAERIAEMRRWMDCLENDRVDLPR
jgi:hypothetical protein